MTEPSQITKPIRVAPPQLCCPVCGNAALFVEIMDFESHLVNGHLNYIRLLDAVTDHYLCHECGERIDPDWLK